MATERILPGTKTTIMPVAIALVSIMTPVGF
jgi:hypothetical protein